MKDRHASFVNEIIDFGNLKEFKNSIKRIVDIIKKANCLIATRMDRGASSLERSLDGTTYCIIRISIKNQRVDSKEIIWDILHEYGHLISGVRNNKQSDLEREIEAWELARLEIENYQDLSEYIDQFNSYAERCLKTYRKVVKK